MRRLIIILALAAILCGGCSPKKIITLTIPDTTVQIMMRLIPAGNFMMGSPDSEQDRDDDEGPQHKVTITEPFYIGIYEVTQEQWEAVMGVMGDNPSYFEASGNPVERVGWGDCEEFLYYLNAMNIGTFRLPTEAEWEYACRAGNSTRFSFGDDQDYSAVGDYAWYIFNSSDTTHTVGEKRPNAWGLYDMHGNVWEWCSDWYDVYDSESRIDPQGPPTGSGKVIRGGCWFSFPSDSRSASRHSSNQWNEKIGFRLVMIAK